MKKLSLVCCPINLKLNEQWGCLKFRPSFKGPEQCLETGLFWCFSKKCLLSYFWWGLVWFLVFLHFFTINSCKGFFNFDFDSTFLRRNFLRVRFRLMVLLHCDLLFYCLPYMSCKKLWELCCGGWHEFLWLRCCLMSVVLNFLRITCSRYSVSDLSLLGVAQGVAFLLLWNFQRLYRSAEWCFEFDSRLSLFVDMYLSRDLLFHVIKFICHRSCAGRYQPFRTIHPIKLFIS